MTRELIAPPNSPRARVSSKASSGAATVSAGQTLPIQFAQSISQSFLGINMKCASCHDSFIDRWKLGEAYGLAAIYSDNAACDPSLRQTDRRNGEGGVAFPRNRPGRSRRTEGRTAQTTRRSHDPSGKWPDDADHRESPLGTTHGSRHRSSARRDADRAMECRPPRFSRQ